MTQVDSVYEELIVMKQERFVTEFRQKFVLITDPFIDVPEVLLTGAFVNGL